MAVNLVWIPTAEVKVGDRIACLLSDAQAYPTVTGWSDRVLNLSRFEGLKDVTHRTFRVSGAPWWAEDMLTDDLAGKSLIVSRDLDGHSISAHESPSGRVLPCPACEEITAKKEGE